MATGLRERKKAKTRASIQQHALRLFRAQGYAAATIEQIADAAEVSPSTFFRYFPTKEDVVMYDDFDPLMIEAFEAQPSDLSPIQALRRAFHEVFDRLSSEDTEGLEERLALINEVPELRARALDEFIRTIQMLAEIVARRVGRKPDDFAVRTFAGALIGISLSTMLAAMEDPSANFVALMDAGLAQLEAGLPL